MLEFNEPKLRAYTTEQLLAELALRKGDILKDDGSVAPGLYNLWAEAKPIASVDMILRRKNLEGQDEIGVILRATGREKGYLALIGGGINKNEPKLETMARHLATDLGVRNFRLVAPQTPESPFYTAEYLHEEWYEEIDHLFDPGKHSVAVTYIVQTDDPLIPRNEASNVVWLRNRQVPARTAYNQGIIMQKAFVWLAKQP